MPLLFQYLFKLSCSLAVVYLFYRVVLRRLTFYNAARWYLLGYSLLCFFIPFLNITRLIGQDQLESSKVVTAIPAIETYTHALKSFPQKNVPALFTLWDACLVIFIAGMVLLLIRLAVQYLSYRNIKKQARLISQNGIAIYQVSKPIIPFSFGNAIFINQGLHSDAELQEIIRHEFVHVKQRHTIDILWTEFLCLVNWYNPAAWALRHAVRQNLEFIADSNVLQSGVDKKEYQYLLLKVMGTPQFRIAAPFNFSSLKKRIVMMNKMKTAKAHLVKFLFILPLLAVLLVAFRNVIKHPEPVQAESTQAAEKTILISGLVVNADNREPLAGVSLHEAFSKTTAITDQRGYFSLAIPVTSYPAQTKLTFVKEGFIDKEFKQRFTADTTTGEIAIVGMIAPNPKSVTVSMVHFIPVSNSTKQDYESVLQHFEKWKNKETTEGQLKAMWANSEKPYWTLNGKSFIVSKGGSWASWDEVVDVVFVDGKKMTGEEVNKTIRRSSFTSVGALGGEMAKKKYGVDQPVFEIYIKTKPEWDTLPAPPPPPTVAPGTTTYMPDDYGKFLKRNPSVKSIHWSERDMIVELKSGKKETYQRHNAKSIETAIKKYGELPVAPPPPPPPPQVLEPAISDTAEQTSGNEQETATTDEFEFLRMRIAQLNDSVRNGNKENIIAMRSYLSERSAMLQKEQNALQSYLQQKQVASVKQKKALQMQLQQRQAALDQDRKASQAYLQKMQAEHQKKQKALQQ